ncbi:MAG: SprB repeat-containing protein, partial [Bacteroidales bacterium]
MKTLKYLFVIYLLTIICDTNAQEWINSTAVLSSGSVKSKEILTENGNIYVTGLFSGSIGDTLTSYGSDDWYLSKYNSDFNISWIKKIGSTGQERDVAMAFDSDKNIIIGGSFVNTCYFTNTENLVSDGLYDIMLAKYNKVNGDLLWKKTIAWGESGQLIAALNVDKNNEIIVTGFYRDSLITSVDTIRGSGFQNFILKLDENGDFKWIKNILSSNTATRISAISAFNDAYYISGTYKDHIYFDIDTLDADIASKAKIFIYKLDYDGNGLWARGSYGNNDDATGTIAQDNYSNIYLSGYYRSTDFHFDSTYNSPSYNLVNHNGSDIFIVKYTKNGNMLWLKGYGRAGSDYAVDIKERDGTLYFTGYYSDSLFINDDTLFNSNAANKDIFLAAADSKGNLLKGESLNATGVFDDFGVSLEITTSTHALLLGDYYSPSLLIGSKTLLNNVSPYSQSFIAEYVPPFSATFTKKTNVSCNKSSDGELIVTPYFGVLPYTYSWSHDAGLNDSTAAGLSIGTYTVTVTDALDSIAIAQYTISEPDSFIFNPAITQVTTCSYSAEGAINLNVTGGNGGNSYYWFEEEGGSGVQLTFEDQFSLTKGKYCVTVNDSKGCSSDTTIYITGPEPITFGNSDVTDYTSPLIKGEIDLEFVGGFGDPASFTFDWTGPSAFSANTEDIFDLDPGNYTVTISDVHSCDFDTTFNVKDLDTFYVYISDYKYACNGTINGHATASYYSPDNHTNITYQWDANADNQTTAKAINLAPGRYYYVTVTDLDNTPNIVMVDSIYIDELSYTFNGSISLSSTSTLNCNGDTVGFIDLNITSEGTLPYSYLWSTGSTMQDIINLPIGTYSVTATDANECQFSIPNYVINQPSVLAATASIVDNP